MKFFSKKNECSNDVIGTFPSFTKTLNENGVKIVLDYLKSKPNDVSFIIDGDFAMYPQLLPEYRQIPKNIMLQGETKSKERLKVCCKYLGQSLLDAGIKIQLRDQEKYLQIETYNADNDEWYPAIIMYDETVNLSQ